MEPLPLTLCVGTRNAAELLPDCVASCAGLTREVLVVDMESEDDTVAVAGRLGAKVVRVPNSGFVEASRQAGIEAAGQPWVLLLDADERAAPGLRELITEYVRQPDLSGVYLPRRNRIFGRWIDHSGYWPDYQMRLFRPDRIHWPPFVHARPELSGRTVSAPAAPANALIHYPYATLSEWVARNNAYTDFEVDRFVALGRNASLGRLLIAPFIRFLNVYVRHQGFRDGLHGLAIAVLMGYYAAMVELKLWERQRWSPDRARRESASR